MIKDTLKILPLLLLLAGCKVEGPEDTLSGNGERTPLTFSVLMDGGAPEVTRAANKDFATGDQLLTYLRHVTWNGETTGERALVSEDQSPRLVTLTVGSGAMTAYTGSDITPIGTGVALGLTSANTNQTTDLVATYTDTEDAIRTGIYWDDFSVGAKGDATDIRTDGHYLQSYYGYCYNGGEPTTALTKEDGVLGWTVQTDQRAANAFQHSDLLWSAEQTPVSYAHNTDVRKGLVLPYTHAMSKVTIVVKLGKGFASDATLGDDCVMTLSSMRTVCTATAPTAELAYDDNTNPLSTITMHPGESQTRQRSYEAIVVPTPLTIGNNFATITNVDGNTYIIPVQASMLQVAAPGNGNRGWGAQLDETTELIDHGVAQAPHRTTIIPTGHGYQMRSGVHYVLTVTIDKQDVTVSAAIRDWQDIEADGTAVVQFAGDITEKGTIADELKTLGLDVYKSNTSTTFDTKSTTLTWSAYESKWLYDPVIYWAGQTDLSYFRALSPSGTTTAMTQGEDILWGTSGNEAVSPRTGDVPLEFEHAMTKITIQLETSSDAAKVDFDGVTIDLCNLATEGTIDIATGNITPSATVEATYTAHHTATSTPQYSLTPIEGKCFIPQNITNEARLKLTLKDGTTYSLQLNTCVDSKSTDFPQPTITTWERGRHYTYTVHVEKEAITFRAMIKAWIESSGSGNATLDWD